MHQGYILSQIQPQNFSPLLGNLLSTSSWPEAVEQWAGAGCGGQLACLNLRGDTSQLGDSGIELTSLDLTFSPRVNVYHCATYFIKQILLKNSYCCGLY